jgi:serine/threonine-protein kinase
MSLRPADVVAGRYRIDALLARGGMGTVYVVTDLRTQHRRALKVLDKRLAGDAKMRERFRLEAQASARIESEHVVQVLDADVDGASGMAWLVIELLHGESLATCLEREGALPLPAAMAILRQIGHAIGAAHRLGIVHRDLKPENVFLAHTRTAAAARTVKVLDFGIATVVRAEGASRNQTAPIGTVH